MWRPTRLEDLVNVDHQIKQLTQWIDNRTVFRAAYFTGPPGLGKTTLAKLFLESKHYEVVYHNAADLRNEKQLTHELYHGVFRFKSSLSPPNNLLAHLIDELDSLTEKATKTLIEYLTNKAIWVPPIILVSNQTDDSLLSYCLHIHFKPPQPAHTYQLAQNLAKFHKLPSISLSAALILSEMAQQDFRRLQMILMAASALIKSTPDPPTQLTEQHIQYIAQLISQKLLPPKLTAISLKDALRLPSINNLPPHFEHLVRNKLPSAFHENYPALIGHLYHNQQSNQELNDMVYAIDQISQADLIAPSPSNLQRNNQQPPVQWYLLQTITFAFPTLTPPNNLIVPLEGRSAYSDHSHYRKKLKGLRQMDQDFTYNDFLQPLDLQYIGQIMAQSPPQELADMAHYFKYDLDNLEGLLKTNKLTAAPTKTQLTNLKKTISTANSLLKSAASINAQPSQNPDEDPIKIVKITRRDTNRPVKPKFMLIPVDPK